VIADADTKLREISQLWALGKRLPHFATPRERALVAEFNAFAADQLAFCSLEAATAGMQTLWVQRKFPEILRAARKLPATTRRDREIRTHIAHARRLIGAVRRRHPGHGHAATALNDLLNDWDPIGVARSVSDEYSAYCAGIIGLLSEGADEAAISRELSRIVQEQMGLAADPNREPRHAAAIVAWYRQINELTNGR
jgi:hypothetical protein